LDDDDNKEDENKEEELLGIDLVGLLWVTLGILVLLQTCYVQLVLTILTRCIEFVHLSAGHLY
jgi:hypothetical protein